jgi:hypothetical protein
VEVLDLCPQRIAGVISYKTQYAHDDDDDDDEAYYTHHRSMDDEDSYIYTYIYTSVGELRPPPVLVVIDILQANHVRRVGQHLAQQQLSPCVPVLDSGVRLVGILEIRQYVVADETEARHT